MPGGRTPPPAEFSLDKVPNPLGKSDTLTFSAAVTLADPHDSPWLKVAPDSRGLPGTFTVSMDSVALGQLSPGDHTAYVAMNAPTGPNDGFDPPNSNTASRVSVTLGVAAAPIDTTLQTQVLAHIADGAGWQTRIVLVNTDVTNSAQVVLHFWPGQDTPLTLLPVLTTGPVSSFTLNDTIPAGGSRTYLTQGSASLPLWQGWVELVAPPSVGGTAVFRQSAGSNQDNEGAVPLKVVDGSQFVLPFDYSSPDSSHSFGTSIAIINADDSQTANVVASAYDQNGNVIALSSPNFPLQARSHRAFALTTPFRELAGKRGTMVFRTTGGQLAGLGLRFSSRRAFTSVQTLTGASGASTKRVAHIADGRGWKTGIVIANLDSVPASVTIRFNRSTITPTATTLALEDPGLVGLVYTTARPIPVNGSLWISTQGTSSNLWQGSATITSTAQIDGSAIFRYQLSSSADSEGAVPFSSPGGTRFLLPFNNTNSFVTSMAMVSPDAQPASVTAVFRNSEGGVIQPNSNTLPLTGHTAFGLTDAAPFGVSGSGVADFSTSGTELLGIGLLFNPKNSFTSVPILKR
jgi:hypothetical protein